MCLSACDVVTCSAKEAGVTIVNEVGVDPGIDHMLAMQCFDEVKIRSGKVSLYNSLFYLALPRCH